MKLSLLLAALLGNVPPPSYLVRLPSGREWVYQYLSWAFFALAVTAGGLWFARRRALRPATRRVLLWLSAGGLAVGYSAGWVWSHRNAGLVPPGLSASVAVWMHGLWALGVAITLLVGWRRVCGRPATRRHVALAGRAFALAVVTLATGGLVGAAGFRLALVVLLPGYLLTEFGNTTEALSLFLFFGCNVLLWWAAWAVFLWSRQGAHENVEQAQPTAVPDSAT